MPQFTFGLKGLMFWVYDPLTAQMAVSVCVAVLAAVVDPLPQAVATRAVRASTATSAAAGRRVGRRRRSRDAVESMKSLLPRGWWDQDDDPRKVRQRGGRIAGTIRGGACSFPRAAPRHCGASGHINMTTGRSAQLGMECSQLATLCQD